MELAGMDFFMPTCNISPHSVLLIGAAAFLLLTSAIVCAWVLLQDKDDDRRAKKKIATPMTMMMKKKMMMAMKYIGRWRSCEDDGLPLGPFAFPVLGNLPQLMLTGLKQRHRYLAELVRRHGPAFTLRLGFTSSGASSSAAAAAAAIVIILPSITPSSSACYNIK
jgi:hypothetical protein